MKISKKCILNSFKIKTATSSGPVDFTFFSLFITVFISAGANGIRNIGMGLDCILRLRLVSGIVDIIFVEADWKDVLKELATASVQ